MARTNITVRIEEARWRNCGVESERVRAAARLALARGLAHDTQHGTTEGRSLTVLLASDERLRELNRRFRGKDAPANVLSFPTGVNGRNYVGDVAIAFGTAAREAAAAKKVLVDHVLHLTVHGVLHLLGYDHAKAQAARAMERLEIAVLRDLGIPNPYAERA
ncbi:MAG TPA: rRNA maturation RNase YbeY [Rhizomicrobium sp.]|jgi:probable rRNA maturation factor|nr:rRNA maturation RNase YbeY [Rhizomicrobium sp.]